MSEHPKDPDPKGQKPERLVPALLFGGAIVLSLAGLALWQRQGLAIWLEQAIAFCT
ncbi:hypothetical protein GCM10009093_12900 [Brevundimonas terrae]|uniref:Phosphatidate cytidylyltransferase n=1 Tax=Brevundimonas terrae TaxID=363631 RepID=A0ABP3I346_9CAUL|nr:hypothetical protein [Brevundimonas terrae]NIJ27714.1 hypothetical protein [Brevundimonas terrae]